VTAIGKFTPDDGTVSVDGGAPESVDVVGSVPYGRTAIGMTTAVVTTTAGKAKNG
jgi:hypothetical protein